ncbi:MAG TPA: ABC transporter permease [Thermoanaerobaculia bacterium]|nr:ABC transporter permease [Thermoanaerobaculia bacterium]
MYLRLILASLRRRFRQLALIVVAVAVAAGTVATLAGFAARVADRLSENLAAFGPNLTVRPEVGGPPRIPALELAEVRRVPGVRRADGVAAAESGGGGGGFERIDVRAEPKRLDEVARAIEARVAGVEARPLLKASESDARLTRRLTLVLAAVSAVSLLLALISVGAATTALVGERRAEIGLLLALGYTGRRVGGLFAGELLVAALLAAVAGELLGELAASGLAAHLLGPGGGVALTWSGLAAASLTAVLVVGLSMAVALSRVEKLDAARVLKGD